MEDEIVETWRNLQLTESKWQVTHFSFHELEELAQRESKSLIGLIITERTVKKDAFKTTIKKFGSYKARKI